MTLSVGTPTHVYQASTYGPPAAALALSATSVLVAFQSTAGGRSVTTQLWTLSGSTITVAATNTFDPDPTSGIGTTAWPIALIKIGTNLNALLVRCSDPSTSFEAVNVLAVTDTGVALTVYGQGGVNSSTDNLVNPDWVAAGVQKSGSGPGLDFFYTYTDATTGKAALGYQYLNYYDGGFGGWSGSAVGNIATSASATLPRYRVLGASPLQAPGVPGASLLIFNDSDNGNTWAVVSGLFGGSGSDIIAASLVTDPASFSADLAPDKYAWLSGSVSGEEYHFPMPGGSYTSGTFTFASVAKFPGSVYGGGMAGSQGGLGAGSIVVPSAAPGHLYLTEVLTSGVNGSTADTAIATGGLVSPDPANLYTTGLRLVPLAAGQALLIGSYGQLGGSYGYWAALVGGTSIPPGLRMTQRSDALGVAPSARMSGQNGVGKMATSVQLSRYPRIAQRDGSGSTSSYA